MEKINGSKKLEKLSIVIPVYNEQAQLETALERVYALPYPNKQIIIVNDGSIDRTRAILENFTSRPGTALVHHSVNQGKGAAIRSGLAHAEGGIIIIQDADLEYNPQEILAVIEPILKNEVKVCYGSRFLTPGTCQRMALPNRIANWVLAWLVSVLFGQRLTDEATAYKAFRREVLGEFTLESQGFEFCPEVTARVLARGHRIQEVPVSFSARTVQEGKKIGFRDFYKAVFTLFKYRLRP